MSAEHQQMGTQWKIIVYVEDTLAAANWLDQSWKQLDLLNQIMSDYDSDSELNQIHLGHPSKQWVPISEPLFEVLSRAQYFSQVSKGAFDVTIGPLSVLWRKAFRRQTFPNAKKIRVAKKKVNYHWLCLNEQSVFLKKNGMRLDLGGIAKGYAVDYLFEFLEQKGINAILVDGGGDIRVGAPPPNQETWTIKLPNEQVYSLVNQSIATSGASYQYLEHKGIRYSHIIDPKIGFGIKGHQLVSVIADRCQDADALASIASLFNGSELKRLQKKVSFDFQVLSF
ncbi:MAG: hypothetical protein Sapg2KO_07670 [Saprospiraceae bacterium]